MNVLRTPKTLAGPELGIAALGFQAWYEARHGEAAYAAFERAPRQAWVDYLAWYREFLGIPVRYRTQLLRIEPADGHFRLHLEHGRLETARKIIVATGFEGSGGTYSRSAARPAARALCSRRRGDRFRRAARQGHRGDRRRRLGLRRRRRSRSKPARDRCTCSPAGRTRRDPDQPRARLSRRLRQLLPDCRTRCAGTRRSAIAAPARPPPAGRDRAGAEVRQFPPAPRRALAFGARGRRAASPPQAADGAYRFDFAIAGTGYAADPALRPEFADFARHILLWRDRYTPPSGEEDPFLGAHPYLGPGNEYLEKAPGTAPYLKDIHCFNPAGFVSFGVPVGDVPSMKRGLPTVTAQISRDLFLADFPAHQQRLRGRRPRIQRSPLRLGRAFPIVTGSDVERLSSNA